MPIPSEATDTSLDRWVPRFTPVTTGLVFPEAPTWHDGDVWVSDVAAGGVCRVSADGSTRTFLPDRRGIGGLVATSDDDLLASGRDLVSVRAGTVQRDRPPGSTGLNDLGTDSTGAVYAGVLTFRPTRGESPTPGAVARLSRYGDDWDWFAGPCWPNGIAATSRGGLVMADFADGRLWYRESADARPRVLATSPTGHMDGLAVDTADRIWVASGPGRSVECWTLAGDRVGSWPVPASFVSSVCFGGPQLRTLYLTVVGRGDGAGGSGAVLAVAAPDPGLAVPPARL